MKIQIVTPAIILAIAAVFGWQIDDRHHAAIAEQQKLVAESRQLGIVGNDGHAQRTRKMVRGGHETEAKQLALEYAAQAKEWWARTMMDKATRRRYDAIHRRISTLEPSQLRIFIRDVLASMDLGEKRQAEHALSLLGTLVVRDPAGVLAFFTENSSALRLVRGSEYFVGSALGNWAKEDPLAALEWMRKNAAEYPEALSAASQTAVINGAAQKDPQMAFSLITDLKLDFYNAHSAMNKIVTTAKTEEEMTNTLAALREYIEANQSNKQLTRAANDNLAYFAQELRKQSFEAATKWIENAKLNPKELDSLAQGLSKNLPDEPGKWIEWLGRAMQPGKSDWPIMDMMDSWTDRDYVASGKWLASAPEGPARNAAIRGYAKTIFPHDRETAVQWLMTLPPNKERDSTFKTIYMNWSKDDPTGKEAFKQQHGIK